MMPTRRLYAIQHKYALEVRDGDNRNEVVRRNRTKRDRPRASKETQKDGEKDTGYEEGMRYRGVRAGDTAEGGFQDTESARDEDQGRPTQSGHTGSEVSRKDTPSLNSRHKS